MHSNRFIAYALLIISALLFSACAAPGRARARRFR